MSDDIVDRIANRPNDAPMPTERLLDAAREAIQHLRSELSAARNASLEEAAKVADDYDDRHNYGDEGRYGKGAAEQIAAAIRDLKDK